MTSPSSSGSGMVAVRKYYPGKAPPSLPGFTTVLIHTSKDTLGGPLSPYHLKNEYGQFLENIWQFSKIYTGVEARRNAKSRGVSNRLRQFVDGILKMPGHRRDRSALLAARPDEQRQDEVARA